MISSGGPDGTVPHTSTGTLTIDSERTHLLSSVSIVSFRFVSFYRSTDGGEGVFLGSPAGGVGHLGSRRVTQGHAAPSQVMRPRTADSVRVRAEIQT